MTFQVSAAHSDECKLHDLILEQALEQDRDFRRRKCARYDEQYDKPDKASKLQNWKGSADLHRRLRSSADHKQGRSDESNRFVRSQAKPAGKRARSAAPKDGCLKCKGPHYGAYCPTATHEERQELSKKFHSKRLGQGCVKRIIERLDGGHAIKLNGALGLQYCDDTGSDWCWISRKNFGKLVRVGTGVRAVTLAKPIIGTTVGGHDVEARESV
ncbi:hypothetical protein PF011_g8857 [Phytophthora fragariae]|uniref:Uncharacterized protein n=1 Tax=Phytophthora fragariae TaxID=53985 RepID=A0A6A3L9I2_9STRA|nr:hypothetical protein PF011_g8857 [Phytophthora fragariae]